MARITVMPKPGIVRAATPNASAGSWWDANMVRFRGGQAQPIGGNASFTPTLADIGRDALTWHDNAGARWAAIGTDTKLLAFNFDTQTLTDITPAGVGALDPPGARAGFGLGDYGEDAYGTARDTSQIGLSDISSLPGDWWSLALFGEDLMIVPTQDGHLYRWKPSTPTVAPLLVQNAPVQNKGVLVTDERHVVLIGAGGNPRMVAWSDQENPDVWAPNVSNMAGDKQLETEGRPFVARRVTGGVLILTDNDAHFMRYVGPPYAYGINKVGANCGPISPRAVSQAGGQTAWMGIQSFWQYSGGNVVPLECDVQDWLFSLINRDVVGRIFGAPNPSFTEHWWYWPDEGSAECNRYVLFNYGERGTPWMIGQQSRTAADISGAMLRPILCGGTKLFMHEYGWTDDGTSRVGTIYIETGDLQLADLGGNPDKRFHVRQIEHDYVGPAGRIGFRFFLWEEPDGPQWDTGDFPADNNVGLTDAKFSCRGCRMRIEALQDGPFAIGRTKLIARQGGSR